MAYDGYYLTYKADKETNERFDEIRKKYPSFRMVKINLEDWADPKIEQAITKIATITNTKHFWIVDPDVKVDDDFDFSFETDDWDDNLTHLWNCDERNVFRSVVGVKLFKTKDVKTNKKSHIKDAYYLTGEYKEHKTDQVNYTPTTETYDIFFWDKGYGYKELSKLKEKYTVNVVEGKSSLDIHKKCRKQTRTDFYYLIMPNTKIYDSFKFDYSFAFGLDKEKQKVVVWQKENPETNLSREYHGVGLFPKAGALFTQKQYDIFNFKRKAVYEKEPASSDLTFEVISTTDLHTFDHEPDSDMYWLVHKEVKDFNSDFYPMSYDREYIHNFNIKLPDGKEVCNGVRLVPTVNATIDKQKDVDLIVGSVTKAKSHLENPIDKTYQHLPNAFEVIRTIDLHTFGHESDRDMYWLVHEDVEEFNSDFYPASYDRKYIHNFKIKLKSGKVIRNGVRLVPTKKPTVDKQKDVNMIVGSIQNRDGSILDATIDRSYQYQSDGIGHPVFYFDEGMYSSNTEKYKKDKTVEVLTGSLEESYMKAAKLTKTGYFWAIDNDVEVLEKFDRKIYIDKHHKSHFHIWPKINPYTGFIHQYGGLKLVPANAIKHLKPNADKIRKMSFKNKKSIKSETVRTRDIPYDVVMLSYQEKEADANYAKLLERVPNAKRVHGVKGIFNAHQRASEIADTKMFYVIDADAILLDDFKFEYFPTVWDEDTVHVWKSKNPINGLVYGFGGLKLFPTQLLRDAKEWRVDFTTSISDKFKAMPGTANYTAFNTNPYDTWKSAFRECTKLSSSVIHRSKQDETDERLEIWCTINNDAKFGEYSIAGANAGRKYGTENADDDEALSKINDYDWLHQKFEENTND
jgi:hypothetical protein